MSSTKRPIQELFPLMYEELRRVAGRYLGRERANHTLQPTALVNEAWLRLQNERGADSPGRTQGLALAAQAMRRVLVDHARGKRAGKRGGPRVQVPLEEGVAVSPPLTIGQEHIDELAAAIRAGLDRL